MNSSEIEQMGRLWKASIQNCLPPETLARIAVTFPALDVAFQEVRRRYSEPTRFYHTLDHVQGVLRLVKADDLVVFSMLNIAAILHDVIYDSRAKDNEERSAEYAHEVLASFGVDRDTREEI